MITYFAERARSWRIWLHVLAPVLWFQLAMMLTGIYVRYNGAQSGPPLEEIPFFDAHTAAERLGSVAASGNTTLAFVFYGVDAVNAALLASGFAALIGFGLRAADLARGCVRFVLFVPAGLFATELLENASLSAALAVSPTSPSSFAVLAGYATGLKFVLFIVSSVLAAAGLVSGVAIWTWRRRAIES